MTVTTPTSVRYAAFLRAINVGGHTVRMAPLRALFEELGFADVSTFIASGNVLFTSRAGSGNGTSGGAHSAAEMEARIEAHLRDALGFEVATLLRTASEVEAAASFTPFPELPDDSHSFYVGLLRSVPTTEAVARAMSRATPVDTVRIHGRELYWAVAGRSTDSKLNGNVLERALGMALTLRNRNTVQKMAVLLSATAPTATAARGGKVPGKPRSGRGET